MPISIFQRLDNFQEEVILLVLVSSFEKLCHITSIERFFPFSVSGSVYILGLTNYILIYVNVELRFQVLLIEIEVTVRILRKRDRPSFKLSHFYCVIP